MKKSLLILLAVGLLGLPVYKVQASEDPDGNKWHITSARWLHSTKDNLDDDDRWVVLCGTVTKAIGKESYIFDDGTGTVQLDSAHFKLPIGKPIVVRGRVDQDFLGEELEVDVRSWRHE